MLTLIFSSAVALVLSIAQAPGGLDAARDLYGAAAFEEALALLDRIDEATLRSPAEGRLVAEYRIFALYALRRTAEAEAAAEALIRRDPSAALVSEDASPRIRSMYDAVRARVLPKLIRDHYQAGRGALEKTDFAAAERALSTSARLLDEARIAKIEDSGLADLRVLVDGFLVLAKSPPAAARASADVPTETPAATATPAKSIYGIADKDVVAPVALEQRLPFVPASLQNSLAQTTRVLVINLTIDETGRVRRAEIATPFNPVYDRMVSAAALKWRYRPATRGGVPVSYMKALSVTVQ